MSFKEEVEKKIVEVELNQQDGYRQVIPIEDIPYDLIIDRELVREIIDEITSGEHPEMNTGWATKLKKELGLK